ncbi:antitoxin YezG family protein [Scopulibacillus cellulosilyticus]|uniref:Antitoxin YezG family protein n=1 Tax=Scopulibacillus cellulosilyticus TaxID=2665665 RepID=A0ABW2PYW4_9BACL
METEVMEELYQRAANLINDIIPENWDKVYLYAEINEDGGRVFFYYYPINDKVPVYSLDIINRFSVEKSEFDELNYDLFECFDELWEEFKRNNQEVWSNLIFILDNTGGFEIEYGYDDITDADQTEIHTVWAYRHLGLIPPEGSYKRELLDNYLKNSKGQE